MAATQRGLFDDEAIRRAQPVKKLKRVVEIDTGRVGTVLSQKDDWVKVRYDDYTKPAFIRPYLLRAVNPAPRFCSDCERELKGTAIMMGDGRYVCPSCAKKAKAKAAQKKQAKLFDDQRMLFNPSRLKNVAMGFRDELGVFHPIKASKDYNEFLTTDVATPRERAKRREEHEDRVRRHEYFKEAQSKRKPKEHRKSLSQFVRARGGIAQAKDDSHRGELKKLSPKESGTTGLLNKRSSTGGKRFVAEYMMDAANEEGYRDRDGHKFRSIGDFLSAVADDATGRKKLFSYADNPTMKKRANKARPIKHKGKTLHGAAAQAVRRAQAKKAAKRKSNTTTKRRPNSFFGRVKGAVVGHKFEVSGSRVLPEVIGVFRAKTAKQAITQAKRDRRGEGKYTNFKAVKLNPGQYKVSANPARKRNAGDDYEVEYTYPDGDSGSVKVSYATNARTAIAKAKSILRDDGVSTLHARFRAYRINPAKRRNGVLAKAAKGVDSFVTRGLLGAAKAVRKAAGKGKRRNGAAQPKKRNAKRAFMVIKPKRRGDVEGFLIYGTDTHGRQIRMFSKTRRQAEELREAARAGDSDKITEIFLRGSKRNPASRKKNLTVNVREIIVKRPKKAKRRRNSTKRYRVDFQYTTQQGGKRWETAGTVYAANKTEAMRKLRPGLKGLKLRAEDITAAYKSNPHTASTHRLSYEFHGQQPSGKTVELYTPPGVPKDVSWIGSIIDIELEGVSKPLEFKNNPKDGDAILGQAQRGSWRRLYIGLKRPYARLSNGQPITRSRSYGQVKAISYWAENGKPHLGEGNKAALYRHPFSNPKPVLVLTKGGTLQLRGGGYTVRAEGIDL